MKPENIFIRNGAYSTREKQLGPEDINLGKLIDEGVKKYLAENPLTVPEEFLPLPVLSAVLQNDFTTSSDSFVAPSDLTVTIPVGTYEIDFIGAAQTTSTSVGVKFTLTGDSTLVAGATMIGTYFGSVSAVAAASETKRTTSLINNAGGNPNNLETNSMSAVDTPHQIGGKFILNVVNAGTLSLKFGSKVNGTAVTLLKNSSLIIKQLS